MREKIKAKILIIQDNKLTVISGPSGWGMILTLPYPHGNVINELKLAYVAVTAIIPSGHDLWFPSDVQENLNI